MRWAGFVFSWYGDRRDLPSFPTRRSSDLGVLSAAGTLTALEQEWLAQAGEIVTINN